MYYAPRVCDTDAEMRERCSDYTAVFSHFQYLSGNLCSYVCVWMRAVSSVGTEVMCKHRRLSARVIVFACINSCLTVKVSVRVWQLPSGSNTGGKNRPRKKASARLGSQAALFLEKATMHWSRFTSFGNQSTDLFLWNPTNSSASSWLPRTNVSRSSGKSSRARLEPLRCDN